MASIVSYLAKMERQKKVRSVYRKKRANVFCGHKATTTPGSAVPPATPTTALLSSILPLLLPCHLPLLVQVTPLSLSLANPGLRRRLLWLGLQLLASLGLHLHFLLLSLHLHLLHRTSEDYHLMKNLMRAIGAFSCCGTPLTIKEDRSQRRGFVSKLDISCSVCGKSSSIQDPYDNNDLQVNTRAVLASSGHGLAGLAEFAGMMGMVPPLTSKHYPEHNMKVLVATRDAADEEMKAAAALLRKDATEGDVLDVKVTVDATWQRRGHQSLYGVVVVASWETGQVLDIEVLSKYCRECAKRQNMDPTSP